MTRSIQSICAILCLSALSACGDGDIKSKYDLQIPPGGDTPESVFLTVIEAAKQSDKDAYLEVAQNADVIMAFAIDRAAKAYQDAKQSGDADKTEKTKLIVERSKSKEEVERFSKRKADKEQKMAVDFERIRDFVQKHLIDVDINPNELERKEPAHPQGYLSAKLRGDWGRLVPGIQLHY